VEDELDVLVLHTAGSSRGGRVRRVRSGAKWMASHSNTRILGYFILGYFRTRILQNSDTTCLFMLRAVGVFTLHWLTK
jgi:hypothetical protein